MTYLLRSAHRWRSCVCSVRISHRAQNEVAEAAPRGTEAVPPTAPVCGPDESLRMPDLNLIPADTDPLEWWSPTECLYACCAACVVEIDGLPLCPKCAKEERPGARADEV